MILIVHSASDSAAADALEDLLLEAIELPPGSIELTDISTDADASELSESLRHDIASCDVVAALVPSDPAGCREVMFQLGAAWSMGKMIFLFFMDGIDYREVPAPIAFCPYVEITETNAHVKMMDMTRDIAEFIGLTPKRNGDPMDAISRLAAASSAEPTPVDEDDPDAYGFGSPSGTISSMPGDDERCGVVITYEEVSLGSSATSRIVVQMEWHEVFRAFAPYLSTPQEDEYIKKLIVESAKTKDTKFHQNVQFGIYKKPLLEPYCYHKIMERFQSSGLIQQSRPPHSAFQQRTASRTHWTITERGEDYLRSNLATGHALQKWNGTSTHAHIPRGAIRQVPKQDI